MGALDDHAGIVAASMGGVVVLLALALLALWLRVRRLARDQRTVLGPTGTGDLVAHAASVAGEVGELEAHIGRLVERINRVDRRAHVGLWRRAIVRYDAYAEGGGMQSISLALLDGDGTGFVLSSIVARDHDRLYVREVVAREGVTPLSPEETDAVARAMAAG